MNITQINKILIRPVITEKMTILQDKKKRNGEPLNQYGFIVEKGATKTEIKKAIEKHFNVKVTSVRTINVEGKSSVRYTKRGFVQGKRADRKKAIVTLAKDNKIEFVEGA